MNLLFGEFGADDTLLGYAWFLWGAMRRCSDKRGRLELDQAI